MSTTQTLTVLSCPAAKYASEDMDELGIEHTSTRKSVDGLLVEVEVFTSKEDSQAVEMMLTDVYGLEKL